MSTLGFLVLASFLHQSSAVRMADDFDAADADGPVNGVAPMTACAQDLQAVFATVSYRELFSPILNGAYRIRNRFSGEYITEGANRYVGASLLHVTTSKRSDWRIKRLTTRGMPMYTIQNRKSGNYLLFEGDTLALSTAKYTKGAWNLALASDGVHRVLRLNSSAAVFDHENRLEVGEYPAAVDSVASLKGEWYLEAYPSWWRIPKSDKNGYADQWKVAGDLPVFPGTELTWQTVCDGGGRIDCGASYSGGRQLFKEMGLLAETDRRYVTQNLLRGSCDIPWVALKYVFQSPEVLSQMKEAAGSGCSEETIVQTDKHLKTAIMATCFDGCLAVVQEVLGPLKCERPENATQIFEDILKHDACDEVRPSSLEGLAEFVMMEKCLTWHPLTPLWTAELNDPQTLKKADGVAPCTVPAGKESSRKESDLLFTQANGVCPSGTTCQCPSQFFETAKQTKDLMFGERLYITEGSSLDAVLQDQLFRQLRSVALRVLVMGYTVGGAIASIPFSMTFLPRQIWTWGRFAIDQSRWRCTQTAGCWPNNPESRRTAESKKACRVPWSAKAGGSVTWFMPPPRVYIKRNPWYAIRKCEWASCEKVHLFSAKVGFSEDFREVFNCQPLPFEAMNATMQEDFRDKLLERLPAEYVGEI